MEENSKSGKERMRSSFIKHYMQPAFLICVVVLGVAGGGMSVGINKLGIYFEKEHLPLRKSLDLLDEKGLDPYRVVLKEKIENEEIIKGLGAEDYIQWILEDLSVPPDSPARYCSLFITYYGLPDVVLHVPEECYMGSGFQRLISESVAIELETRKIPVKYLVFTGVDPSYWQKSVEFPVFYLFKVNKSFVSSGDSARFVLNRNIRGKHSYFCKVEWKFFNTKFRAELRLSDAMIYPGKDEAVKASSKLLSVILPILEKEHWPIWEKMKTPDSVPRQEDLEDK